MPKRIVPLTDTKILKTKPEQKQKALFDGGGLFLLVTPTGGKRTRLILYTAIRDRFMLSRSNPAVVNYRGD